MEDTFCAFDYDYERLIFLVRNKREVIILSPDIFVDILEATCTGFLLIYCNHRVFRFHIT